MISLEIKVLLRIKIKAIKIMTISSFSKLKNHSLQAILNTRKEMQFISQIVVPIIFKMTFLISKKVQILGNKSQLLQQII